MKSKLSRPRAKLYLMQAALGLILAGALLLAAGCAEKPPKEEREAAELAFKNAKLAEKCATLKYQSAEQALNEARKLTTEKKYEDARQFFIVARNLAEEAKTEAEKNKECEKKPAPPPEAPVTEAAAPADSEFSDPNYDLKRIHFGFDSYDINDAAKEILKKNAQWMNRHADVKILIEGHCDQRGSEEYNLSLGDRRAQSVKQFLTQLSVNPDNLDVISYGHERPLSEAKTEESFATNRRAEFKKIWKR